MEAYNDAHILIAAHRERQETPEYRISIILRLLFSAILIVSTLLDEIEALQLAGKLALVTGLPGGIEAAIAKQLASEGAEVIVHYNARRDGEIATHKSIVDAGGTCSGIFQLPFSKPLCLFQNVFLGGRNLGKWFGHSHQQCRHCDQIGIQR